MVSVRKITPAQVANTKGHKHMPQAQIRRLDLLPNSTPAQLEILRDLITQKGKHNPRELCRVKYEEHRHDSVNPFSNYQNMSRVQLILALANEYTAGYGVEVIRSVDDTMHRFHGLEYVNQGDTYSTTLVYDHKAARFYVCSWGDIVEAHPGRFE